MSNQEWWKIIVAIPVDGFMERIERYTAYGAENGQRLMDELKAKYPNARFSGTRTGKGRDYENTEADIAEAVADARRHLRENKHGDDDE